METGQHQSVAYFIVNILQEDSDRCTAGSAGVMHSGLTGRDVFLYGALSSME